MSLILDLPRAPARKRRNNKLSPSSIITFDNGGN
jgi:hypothetical protein